jgi:phage baseplate assembly protein W
MELPDELQQPSISHREEPCNIPFGSPYKGDYVPYGVLKGGLKPSYREWSKTQRSNIVTNPNASLIIQDGGINSQQIARENRLNLLKEKIKQKNKVKQEPIIAENLIKSQEDLFKKSIETNIPIINTYDDTKNISPPLMDIAEPNIITEKLENPNFGTIIWDMLFEPLTDENKKLIADNVEQIINYDPRVTVNSVQINSAQQGIRIEATITYVPFNITERMSFVFDRNNNITGT